MRAGHEPEMLMEGDPTPDRGAARRTGPRGVRGWSRSTPPRSPSRRTGGWWTVSNVRKSREAFFNPGATNGISPGHPADAAGDRRLRRHRGRGVRFASERVDELFAVDRLMLVRSVGREVYCLVDPCEASASPSTPWNFSTQPSCPSPSWRPHRRCARSSRRSPGTGRSTPKAGRPPATSMGSAEPASPSRTSIGCASGSRHPASPYLRSPPTSTAGGEARTVTSSSP